MSDGSNPLALAAALTRRTEQLCIGLEHGIADIYERVTPVTAELLRWCFGEEACQARSLNFLAITEMVAALPAAAMISLHYMATARRGFRHASPSSTVRARISLFAPLKSRWNAALRVTFSLFDVVARLLNLCQA